MRPWNALIAALLLASSSHALASERPAEIVPVDDRGAPITEELELCFRISLQQSCRTVGSGETVSWPEAAEGVTAEGPRHGPVSVRRGELRRNEQESLVLVVPRKAELAVRGLPEGGEVSLYRADDRLFLRPAFRYRWDPGSAPPWVPSGDFLVSLAAGGNAPDLHHVAASPGGRLSLRYHARPGWSAVLRVVRTEDEQPVSDASVRIFDADPAVEASREIASVRSDEAGLALVSGLDTLVVRAQVDHPRYVRVEAPAILAARGTFGVRELALHEGARVEAEVTLRGEPSPSAACQVLAPPGPGGKYRGEAVALFEASADRDGKCSFGKVPEGQYTLRVSPPGAEAHVDRPLHPLDGELTRISVDLLPIRVHGEVHVGDEPGSAYHLDLRALRPERSGLSYHSQGEATTADDGSFETTVWAPGSYLAILSDPSGTPAMTRRADLEAAEERLDFHLEEESVQGAVVDSAGDPVAEASVTLAWNDSSYRLAISGPDGRFVFPVDSEGTGRLEVRKKGFVSPEATAVQVVEGSTTPPVVLRLEERPAVEGTVVSWSHVPVAGAWVATYGATDGRPPWLLGESTTQADGRFRLPRLPEGLTRTFVSGPGCPLVESTSVGTPEDMTVVCTDEPGAVILRLASETGTPLSGLGLIVRGKFGVIPRHVLRSHLARFGLPGVTDGSGQLTVILQPGTYDLFLEGSSSEDSVAGGYREGFLASVTISPFATEEMLLTVASR